MKKHKPNKQPVVSAKVTHDDIKAIESEITRREWTISHYVRRALLAQLERDRTAQQQEAA